MIKVVDIRKVGDGTQILELYADKKSEVPTTGAATAERVVGWEDPNVQGTIPIGSTMITPGNDYAKLTGNDTWVWYTNGGGGGSGAGRFLSGWNCQTGMPVPDLDPIPFSFRAGDFFVVKTVAAEGGTNIKPSGLVYMGDPSTETETESVRESDFYFFTGGSWIHVHNEGGGGGEGTIIDVLLNGVTIVEGGVAKIPLASNLKDGAMSRDDKINLEEMVHPSGTTSYEVWGNDGHGKAEWKQIVTATHEHHGLMSKNDKIDFDVINTPTKALIDQVWTANGQGGASWQTPEKVVIGRLIGAWSTATGKPTTTMDPIPFVYEGGDYYFVTEVATDSGAKNYRPDGTQYDGTASTVEEPKNVGVGDMYLFIGKTNKWVLFPVGSSLMKTVKDVKINGNSVVVDRIADIPLANADQDGAMSNNDKMQLDYIAKPAIEHLKQVWTATEDGGEWADPTGGEGGGGDRVDFDDDENMIVDLGTMQPVEANPEFDGSERALVGLRVGDYKYKITGGSGGGAVDDVTINGTTIVTGGIAKIPTMNPDTAAEYGLISKDDYSSFSKVEANPEGVAPVKNLTTIKINDESYNVVGGSGAAGVEDIFAGDISIVQNKEGSLFGYLPLHDRTAEPVPWGLLALEDFELLSSVEQNTNKVPYIDETVLHAQYPTAKAVFDYIEMNPENTGEAYPQLKLIRVGKNIYQIGEGEGGVTITDIQVLDPVTGYWNSIVGSDGIAKIPSYQLLEDKVTKITKNSTDDQYPTAKCVYDIVGDIESLLGALL